MIRTFRHAVQNFHLKDFAGKDWKVLGEGTIDFAPVFAAMKESGGDVVNGMRKCAAVMKTML